MPATFRDSSVVRFIARTLADAANETPETKDNPEGSCLQLVNLVPDRATPGLHAPRPGKALLLSMVSGDFNGIASVFLVLGTRIYGMVNSVSLSPNEVPFCYDTSTASFVTITGSTSGNTPSGAKTTQTTDWSPPTMALVGTKVILTHPGFSGSNFIGWIDISVPASPTWHAGDLTGAIQFATAGVLPVAVSNFNGRAYYAVNNTEIFSDILSATNCTNANQILTIGDNNPILGHIGQPFTSSQLGGIIQSLAVFKSLSIAQITGDAALTGGVTVNIVITGVGCAAPRTLAVTPLGVMFMANDGIRALQLSGAVSEPLPAVKLPFIRVTNATRASAAYNNGVYRIGLQTAPTAGATIGYYEYHYDLKFGWSGPHPKCWSHIQPYGMGFLVNRSPGVSTGLLTYSVTPTGSDTYTDEGYVATPNWLRQSAYFKNEPPMSARDLLESQIRYLSSGQGETVTVSSITPQGTQQTQTFMGVVAGTLWGSFNWGAANWNYSQGAMQPYRVPWNDVTAFDDLSITVSAAPLVNQRVGWEEHRVRILPIGTQVAPP